MDQFLLFLGDYQGVLYFVLAIGLVFAGRTLAQAWSESGLAVYGLEKEFAQRRLNQSLATVVLILILMCAVFLPVTFLLPAIPAGSLIPTPTVDMLATPTGTISPELATAIALTPRPTSTSASSSGCMAGSSEITSPKSGDQVSGAVDIQGTASIANFGFYKYEVSAAGSDVWSTIAAGRQAVVTGSLGAWDTSALAVGEYRLRLVVTDNQGQALTPCVVNVGVVPKP